VKLCLLKIPNLLQTEFAAVAPGRGTVFGRGTNVKQRKLSEFPSGNSKTSNVHGRGTGIRAQKHFNDKKDIKLMASVM
jgi:hypothetical protein